MIAQPAAPDARHYTAQYELLRSQVIAARGDAASSDRAAQLRGVGLALLLREGVPGWLKAVDAVIRASELQPTGAAVRPPAPGRPAGHSITPTCLSGVPRHDLTALLASLVLSTRRVDCPSATEECVPCQ